MAESIPDLAWAYDFPTRQLLPIAGLVTFYNEKVDVTVDGAHLERPGDPLLLTGPDPVAGHREAVEPVGRPSGRIRSRTVNY